eukprot:13211291-Alexandrium_andersonii.AAC.1
MLVSSPACNDFVAGASVNVPSDSSRKGHGRNSGREGSEHGVLECLKVERRTMCGCSATSAPAS